MVLIFIKLFLVNQISKVVFDIQLMKFEMNYERFKKKKFWENDDLLLNMDLTPGPWASVVSTSLTRQK